MLSSSARTFLKILLFWIAVYVLTLYTWKTPNVPLDKSYLSTYKIEEAPLWDSEESLRINEASCPSIGVNYDRNAVSGNEEKWASMSKDDISTLRTGMMNHLQTAKHEGSTAGRGIVMSAGDAAALQRAGVSISMLRSFGCQLPIQIYHYEDEADRISPTMVQMLSELGANIIELSGLKRGTEWKAYQIKAIAIQRCTFEEVLYLDTDSYLVKDPTYLFDSEPYVATGVMLWPDFTKSHPKNPIWRLLGIPCRPEFEGESGQLLFNRAKHQKAMHLAEYFALENNKFYHMTGGDRDSFRIALLALGESWAGPKRLVATAGIDRKYGGHTMMQSDHLGHWLFVHANLLKHSSLPRDSPQIWKKLTYIRNETFVGKHGYGTLKGNEKVGDGVKLDVASLPAMFTEYSSFSEKEDEKVEKEWRSQHLTEEDFKSADVALADFEAKFLQFGGKRM